MTNIFRQHLHSNNHFIEIDAMRGVSAVIIMLHHYSKYIQGINHDSNLFFDVIEFGKYTIQLFFIISGFLIFMTLDKSRHPKDFVVSRFSRLYPAYWICMTITAIVITVSPYYNYAPVTTVQYLANLTMFQHWMHIENMDGIYWTLAVELCFYILIFFVFIFKKQKAIEGIGAIWLVIMLIQFFAVKNNFAPDVNYYYYLPLLRNGNLFLAGILFYRLLKKEGSDWIYILLIASLGVHFIINSMEESFAVALCYLLFYLFVIGKLQFLRKSVLYFLGMICYTLYLLHQYIGYEIINFLNASGIENTFSKIAITSVLIIGLAALITFTIERPAMKYIRRKMIRH